MDLCTKTFGPSVQDIKVDDITVIRIKKRVS